MSICFKNIKSANNYGYAFVPLMKGAHTPNTGSIAEGGKRLVIPFAPEYSHLDLNPRAAISKAQFIHVEHGLISDEVINEWSAAIMRDAIALSGAKIPRERLGISEEGIVDKEVLRSITDELGQRFWVWYKYGAIGAPLTFQLLLPTALAAKGGGFADDGTTPVYPGTGLDAREAFFSELFESPAFSFDFVNQGKKCPISEIFCDQLYCIIQSREIPQQVSLSTEDIVMTIENSSEAFPARTLPSEKAFRKCDLMSMKPVISHNFPFSSRAILGQHFLHFCSRGSVVVIERTFPTLEVANYRTITPLEVSAEVANHETYLSELGLQFFDRNYSPLIYGIPDENPVMGMETPKVSGLVC